MSGVPHVMIVIKTTVSEPGINLSQAKTSLFNELHSQGKNRGKTWLINHQTGLIIMQVRYQISTKIPFTFVETLLQLQNADDDWNGYPFPACSSQLLHYL